MLGSLLIILVRSSAARAIRRSKTAATTGVQGQLESSVVARVLQSVAAAAEFSCARGSMATKYVRTPCIHHVHTWQFFFSISMRFIIFFSDLRTTYSVACKSSSGVSTALFVQCAHVTQLGCHSAAPVVAVATATTHNRGIAATPAVAGTGCFSFGYRCGTFARATRLLLLLLMLLDTRRNKCEVSSFHSSSRSYKNPADHTDPANRTETESR